MTISTREWQVAVDTDDEQDAWLLREACTEVDVECDRMRGSLDPASVLVIIGSGSLVVAAVSNWLARRRRTGEQSWGQVIDLRPGAELLVSRDRNLEFGQIVIVTLLEDGRTAAVRVETYNPDNDFTEVAKLVFGRLADGAAKSLEGLALVTRQAVGELAAVSEVSTSDEVAT